MNVNEMKTRGNIFSYPTVTSNKIYDIEEVRAYREKNKILIKPHHLTNKLDILKQVGNANFISDHMVKIAYWTHK